MQASWKDSIYRQREQLACELHAITAKIIWRKVLTRLIETFRDERLWR